MRIPGGIDHRIGSPEAKFPTEQTVSFLANLKFIVRPRFLLKAPVKFHFGWANVFPTNRSLPPPPSYGIFNSQLFEGKLWVHRGYSRWKKKEKEKEKTSIRLSEADIRNYRRRVAYLTD